MAAALPVTDGESDSRRRKRCRLSSGNCDIDCVKRTGILLGPDAGCAGPGRHSPSGSPADSTGQNELNLLASGGGISVSSANQAFFYEARLQAAQAAAEPRVKFQLLENALSDTPTRDDARIPLFFAAAGVQSDQFARAVMEPLLRQQYQGRVPPLTTREDEFITSETDNAANESITGWLATSLSLAPAPQSRVAWTLAEVSARIDRLTEGLSYLQIAHQLEKTPARRQEIAGKIVSLRLQIRRQQLNAARQPILHEALEQDRQVHPKLPRPKSLASAAAPESTSVQKEVKQ